YAYQAGNGSIKWEFNLDQAMATLNPGANPRIIYCSPSVGSDGTIYLAVRDLQSPSSNRKSILLALNPDGTSKWIYEFGYDVNINYITVAVDNSDRVFVGGLTNTPFNVVVIDAANGNEIKRIPSP